MKFSTLITFLIFLTFNSYLLLAQCPTVGTLIVLDSQADVDAFPTQYAACNVFENEILIAGADITDLTSLSQIEEILEYPLRIINNPNLTNLSGLENIQSVGNLQINQNSSLQNLDGLTGLASLTGRVVAGEQLPGSLSIINNAALENTAGLTNLSTIQASSLNDSDPLVIQIENNDLLTDLSGFEGLTVIPGRVLIKRNDNLISLNGFDNIESLTLLTIDDNDALIHLDDLSSLTALLALQLSNNESVLNIDGLLGITEIFSINIFNNFSLQNLDGLININTYGEFASLVISTNANLTSVSGLSNIDVLPGGNLEIKNNDSLTTIDGVWDLQSIDNDPVGVFTNLIIENNDALIDLSGLSNLSSVSGDVSIRDNNQLISLDGLQNLALIENSLILFNNSSLENLTGLNGVAQVGNDLVITTNPSLDDVTALQNLGAIGTEQNSGMANLAVDVCGALTSLDGLQNIDPDSIEFLILVDNPSLSFCSLSNLCAHIDSGGNTNISGNLPGCNTPDDITTGCDPLGVQDVQTSNDWMVYRSKDKLCVDFNNTHVDDILIYDITGRTLLNRHIENQERIDLGITPANQFLIIQVSTSTGKQLSKKVIF
ncbi:hypothetical protein GCM10009117_02020 [Gangjinia marincola]|uniref:Receptor L-domain domain-containing protein n=1 Tax=Gangjinia marincola TaxID=578463 RepID=A0ABN1MD81_9FLAO